MMTMIMLVNMMVKIMMTEIIFSIMLIMKKIVKMLI